MLNLYKSFSIKLESDEINEEPENEKDEGNKSTASVDLKEQSFQAIKNLEGTFISIGNKPRNTTVSDLLQNLLENLGEESPDQLQKNLPNVVNHLIEHGKPTKDPKSKFWSGDNYTLGV